MMSAVKIARDEIRYWWRSGLALSALIILFLLVCVSIFVTTERMHQAHEDREQMQEKAHDTFLEQPDRHPHRMVHYGHYVFRTPPPLSSLDPGVDSVTGTSIFLEGHRQNTAMFAEKRQSPNLSLFSAFTPAFIMQTLAPLFIVLMGFTALTRETEAGTLSMLRAQGVSIGSLLAGKTAALLLAAFVALIPLIIVVILAGESALVSFSFVGGYMVYLAFWCVLSVFVSSLVKMANTSLLTLFVLWIVFVLLIPRIASSTAEAAFDVPGKIENDFAMQNALKTVGDGHNAGDSAFQVLKVNLLRQYDVDTVEELPINFRGIVAETAEADLTKIMNEFAENRMRAEKDQAAINWRFSLLSPLVALEEMSEILAGVDLEGYHRFLREAERVRFDFVQSLNRAHAEQMAYVDDIRRSSDPDSEKRTRISASNWSALEDFHFEPPPPSERLARALPSFGLMLFWLVALGFIALWFGRTREA